MAAWWVGEGMGSVGGEEVGLVEVDVGMSKGGEEEGRSWTGRLG